MTLPSLQTLYDVTDATWPSAGVKQVDGWLIKNGAGGGKRVSACVQMDADANIMIAEEHMLALGQDLLFQIRAGDERLDQNLETLGYDLIDRVILMAGPLVGMHKTFNGQMENAPTPEMVDIWAEGGIGPARLKVMERASCIKAYARIDDAAVAYAAIDQGICMAHAVEVSAKHRRKGLGRKIMRQIAGWASKQGAEFMAVITVQDNIAARTLYQTLGLSEVGEYHYRIKRV